MLRDTANAAYAATAYGGHSASDLIRRDLASAMALMLLGLAAAIFTPRSRPGRVYSDFADPYVVRLSKQAQFRHSVKTSLKLCDV